MNLEIKSTGKCPSCLRDFSGKPRYRLSQFSVYDCVYCGMRFIDPSLTAEQQIALYQNSKVLMDMYPALEQYYEYDSSDKHSLTARDYERALDEAAGLVSGRELCEIGCGTGAFLQFARQKGWAVTGVDSSGENIKALEKQGMRGVVVDMFALGTEKRFDCVVLWDVIEHPQNIPSLLLVCQRLLSPGGILLVATPCYPNLLSLLAGFFYRLSRGRILGPVEKMYMLVHTTYFSKKILRDVLDINGYELVKGWKTETDLKRYHFSPLISVALHLAFILARFLGLQNRLIALARLQKQK